ncbi:ABC transporter ATP-binding protein [Acidipropionibacterium jensenii]|uniref:ABC transporter ATP-binding protein n=1 Tax=Acidipropionibacterium jensenii TaxID=1749 RepID=UPI0026481194|nr:ABC transporter ATP-binding protein [Acidipropionibacterium jensenii]MDN5976746.1 ABC transporter ATP-binding protein/permease [Acidipropionibacterium jensenii]MDN5995417.1 ABC transporter ATP-binding protein/permease [Acidipropionibacterium jensenii]MDN6425892.1 ABC transporter ATP-binding protein/permease [Acidipropionibacterium jensenii]MDN6441131.1 ABC transporter ATP-binding protein/permease [Acidipropionibacterium jensenii]MDN6479959.1 ABC transporter ATP-binding protein/permease [Aci
MSFPGMVRTGGMRRIDETAQRAINAQAPRIENLRGRAMSLFAPYRGRIAVTCIIVVVSAGLGVIPPLLVKRVFDEALFPPGGQPVMGLLAGLVAAMIGFYLLAAALNVFQTWLTATVGNSVTGDLRVRLYEHLQEMELGFFTHTRTGVIQSRLQNDVGGVSSVLTSTVTSILGNAVTVIASLVAMVLIDWRLTVVAVILMPVLVVVQRRVGQIRARIAGQTQESLSELTAITQETLSVSGVLLAKSFNRQAAEAARYRTENRNQVGLQVRRAMSGQSFFAVVQVLMASVPAIIYLLAGWLIIGGWSGLTAGAVVAFTTVQARLLNPLVGLMRVTLEVQTSQALFARIFEYLDLVPAVRDRPDACPVAEAPGPRGRIVLDAVTFRYPDAAPGSRPTLDDVSLVAEPGQHIALVGPSGSGKSTILSLISRLYEASEGRVVYAGADVRTLQSASLIDDIGIVSQETYLFHASIAENLRYARPGASDEELIEACTAANIHHVIVGFEHGYDTVVGERGYRLSGGEKQRIAIARVLLKDPPVLLLDEATSSLDTVSEHLVQEAIDALAHGRTTLTVAHRLSTVVDADLIHVIRDGRIIESGGHADLMARGGLYAELAAQQLAGGVAIRTPATGRTS